jgi:uncharacterized Zn finger protein (UPF0148 family)
MWICVTAQTKDGRTFTQYCDTTAELVEKERVAFERIAAEYIERTQSHEPVTITGIKVLDQ